MAQEPRSRAGRKGQRPSGHGPPRAVSAAQPALPPGERQRQPRQPSPSLSPGRLPLQRRLPAQSGAGAERAAAEEMAAGAPRPHGLLSSSRSSQPTAPMTAQAAKNSQPGQQTQSAPQREPQPPAAPTHRSMSRPAPPAAQQLPAGLSGTVPQRPRGFRLCSSHRPTPTGPRPARSQVCPSRCLTENPGSGAGACGERGSGLELERRVWVTKAFNWARRSRRAGVSTDTGTARRDALKNAGLDHFPVPPSSTTLGTCVLQPHSLGFRVSI